MELLAEVFAALQTIEKEHEAEAVTKPKKAGRACPNIAPQGKTRAPSSPKIPKSHRRLER